MQNKQKITYAAATWAFAFAAISFYWATGGMFATSTVGNQIVGMATAHRSLFSLVLWVDGAAKAGLGLLALALVQSWGKMFPRNLLAFASWIIGLGMVFYGAFELAGTGISALLMITGVIGTSANVDWTGIIGHVAIWDPYWLLGGVLFVLTSHLTSGQVRILIKNKVSHRAASI